MPGPKSVTAFVRPGGFLSGCRPSSALGGNRRTRLKLQQTILELLCGGTDNVDYQTGVGQHGPVFIRLRMAENVTQGR
jgi:hypothetical protein